MSSRKPKQASEAPQPSLEERVVHWVQEHQQILLGVAGVVAAVVLVAWWLQVAGERKAAVGEQTLNAARFQMQTGNYGEAATGFSEVQERFSGTPSANEAVLLLNELRLIQGQAALAAQDLEGFAPNAPRRFRVKAYMLLGAAREDAGQAIEGAVAYAAAAEAARFDYEAARALLDAGRAYTNGGDTAQAILSYRRITEDYPETAVVLDAQLRLTELEEASKAQ